MGRRNRAPLEKFPKQARSDFCILISGFDQGCLCAKRSLGSGRKTVMRLVGKVAVVTGAATGLGRVYALRLASEGADVCVGDIDLQGTEKTAALIREKGRKSLAIKMDVTSEEETING